MSPLQRTIAVLKERGLTTRKVEVWNHFAHIRQDLWGFDVLGLGAGELWFVQVTGDSGRAEHRDALLENPVVPLLQAVRGVRLFLHSWGKHGARGRRKVWTLYEEEITPAHKQAGAA